MAAPLSRESSSTGRGSEGARRILISPATEMMATFKDDVTTVVPALRAFSRFLCRDRHASDHLVERTIHSAFTARRLDLPVASLKASLFKVMRNDFRAGLRAHHRQQRAARMCATGTLKPIRHIEEATSRNAFSTALWNLTAHNREAFVLIEAAEFSCNDAAHICGCSKARIEVRVSRAHHQLATELKHIALTTASTAT